jgi:hypothetical protein
LFCFELILLTSTYQIKHETAGQRAHPIHHLTKANANANGRQPQRAWTQASIQPTALSRANARRHPAHRPLACKRRRPASPSLSPSRVGTPLPSPPPSRVQTQPSPSPSPSPARRPLARGHAVTQPATLSRPNEGGPRHPAQSPRVQTHEGRVIQAAALLRANAGGTPSPSPPPSRPNAAGPRHLARPPRLGSHSVFTLRIAGSGETCEGWDLAASERLNASRAGSDREWLNETQSGAEGEGRHPARRRLAYICSTIAIL